MNPEPVTKVWTHYIQAQQASHNSGLSVHYSVHTKRGRKKIEVCLFNPDARTQISRGRYNYRVTMSHDHLMRTNWKVLRGNGAGLLLIGCYATVVLLRDKVW